MVKPLLMGGFSDVYFLQFKFPCSISRISGLVDFSKEGDVIDLSHEEGSWLFMYEESYQRTSIMKGVGSLQIPGKTQSVLHE